VNVFSAFMKHMIQEAHIVLELPEGWLAPKVSYISVGPKLVMIWTQHAGGREILLWPRYASLN